MEFITLPTYINMTPEIGMELKKFRIDNKITAKKIIEKFGKATTYLSKLEKGDIKKVDVTFFVELCNYISNNQNTLGVSLFISKISNSFSEYSPETQISIMNIDDLTCLHRVKKEFINHICDYMKENNITENDLTANINSNKSITETTGYENLPENEWLLIDNDIDKAVIKFNIPLEFIVNLLGGNIKYINHILAEGILYNLYNMGGESDKVVIHVSETLKKFNIFASRGRKIISINSNNLDELDKYFGGLEPHIKESLQRITTDLNFVTRISKEIGTKRIKLIEQNFKDDLGFYFAYMGQDLSEVECKSKQTKSEFLIELKQLINKYSEPDKESLDLYIDE